MKKILLILIFCTLSFLGFTQNIDSLQKYIQKSIETAVYLRNKNVIQKSSLLFIEIEPKSKVEIISFKSDTTLGAYSSLIREELINSSVIRNYQGLKIVVPVLLISPTENNYQIDENMIASYFATIVKNAVPVILAKRVVLSFYNIIK